MLVSEGLLSPDRLKRVLETQGLLGGRFGTSLLELGFLGDELLLDALGRQRKSKTASAADLARVPSSVTKLITEKFAKRYRIVPFRLDSKTLSIASLDPGDILVQDEVSFLTGCRVVTHVALELRLFEALERYYGFPLPRRLAALSLRLSKSAGGEPAPVEPTTAPRSGAIPAAQRSSAPPSFARPPAAAPPPRPTPMFRSPFLKAGDESLSLGIELDEEFSFSTGGAPPPAPPPAPHRAPVLEIELGAEDLARLETPAAPQPAEPPPPLPDRIEVEPPPPLPVPLPPEAETTIENAPEEAKSPEEWLEIAARELQNAEMRDDIADALLGFAASCFQRRALFMIRKENVVGWYGDGVGVDAAAIRGIELPSEEPSVFHGILQGQNYWLGPLAPMPRNRELIAALGGVPPRDCLVLPVSLKNRIVCFLYGDNLGAGVAGAPMVELRRLVSKAGLAFEVYILKNKIRTL